MRTCGRVRDYLIAARSRASFVLARSGLDSGMGNTAAGTCRGCRRFAFRGPHRIRRPFRGRVPSREGLTLSEAPDSFVELPALLSPGRATDPERDRRPPREGAGGAPLAWRLLRGPSGSDVAGHVDRTRSTHSRIPETLPRDGGQNTAPCDSIAASQPSRNASSSHASDDHARSVSGLMLPRSQRIAAAIRHRPPDDDAPSDGRTAHRGDSSSRAMPPPRARTRLPACSPRR